MINIDYRDSRHIYEQVKDAYRQQILAGILEAGAEMPSVRSLASSLAVNPNTIQRAYRELEAEGFICSVKGKGSFVSLSEEASEGLKRELLESFDNTVKELRALGVTAESLMERLGGNGHE